MFSGIRLAYILTCLFSSNKLLVDIFQVLFAKTTLTNVQIMRVFVTQEYAEIFQVSKSWFPFSSKLAPDPNEC